MWTTNVSPTAPARSPVAPINMPEASMATWPAGSLTSVKTVAGSAAMGRSTSNRSVMPPSSQPPPSPQRGGHAGELAGDVGARRLVRDLGHPGGGEGGDLVPQLRGRPAEGEGGEQVGGLDDRFPFEGGDPDHVALVQRQVPLPDRHRLDGRH